MNQAGESTTLYVRDFRLAEWRVRPSLNRLERDREVFQVEPKSMAVLVDLAEHAGKVRSKRRLLRVVWGDGFVTDDVLTHAIWELRKVLGDDAKKPKYIETIPRKGYRLVAQKTELEKGASRYRILEKLGGGGMGVVYKAEDTLLRRTVALKFLPAELSKDPTAKERFLQEARAAARLAQPNIAVVHDVGEDPEGRMFIAMDCYDGETIKEKAARAPLPIDQCLELAEQIARGLSAAHGQGIVHRDIKPANVMVTKNGEAKIVDFGLAKLTGTASLTRTGRTPGTTAYMSPEQLLGHDVDHRTDLWSLGVVLYEMLAGKRPFGGNSAASAVQSILQKEPSPLSDSRPDCPQAVRDVVRALLKKDPEHRYQSAEDVRQRLATLRSGEAVTEVEPRRPFPEPPQPIRRRLLGAGAALVAVALAVGLYVGKLRPQAPVPGSVAIRSLAVLPLENLSGDSEQEWFSDGMTDALINELARIGSLRVTSRNSVMPFKGSETPLPAIARRLNVAALVTGAVVLSEGQVRVTAQLIQPETGEHLWADRFDRSLVNVVALQNEIVAAIVRRVEAELTGEEEVRLAAARPVDPEAHEAYLKGMFHVNQDTPEGYERGLAYLRQAVEADPEYAKAYAGVAHVYFFLGIGHSSMPQRDAFALAKAAVQQALELDESLSDAHAVLGRIRSEEGDLIGAEQSFRRAIELSPNSALAHNRFGGHLAWNRSGRADEAIAENRLAQKLDPLSAGITANLAMAYWRAGRLDQALAELEKSLELQPNYPPAFMGLGEIYKEKGMYEEAVEAHQKAAEGNPESGIGLSLAHTYVVAGRRAEGRMILRDLSEAMKRKYALDIARVHAALGETEDALRWLERACEEGSFLPVRIRDWPDFDPLRSDPHFQDLLRCLNLPE